MKRNYQLELDKKIEEIVNLGKRPKLLLHSCCAPCSTYVLEYLSNYFDITLYYYNPNLDTKEEFNLRSEEQQKLAKRLNIKCITEKYNEKEYIEAIKGNEEDPEGGPRCFKCYKLRLLRAAQYALKGGFDYFTTTLSISPYKNSNKLNEIGEELEKELGIKYLQADFKKHEGYKRSIELSKKYNLYRQDYCGCIYSKMEHEKRIKKTDEIKKPKKRIKKTNILLLLALISILIYPTFSLVKVSANKIKSPTIKTEKVKTNLTELTIYGNHLNLVGDLKIDTPLDKVTIFFSNSKNKLEIDPIYEIIDGTLKFKLSEEINSGFIMDNMKVGNYQLYLKTYNKDIIKFYKINNKTNYNKTTYYTVTNKKKRKEITITQKDTLNIAVKPTNKEVYDIVIDPGHGGTDSGACFNNVCETDYTLNLSKTLKKNLQKKGYKVKLTREENKTLNTYGKNSRTGIPYEAKAKFLLSIHLNSGPNIGGFEFYAPYNADYTFAKKLVENIEKIDDMNASPSTFNRVSSGVYSRTMADYDLKNIEKEAINKNYTPYDIVSNQTNYYYIIRETGGYMSGAYIDSREENGNPYVKRNTGIESYILELGYITNINDIKNVEKNESKYMEVIANSIDQYLLHN